MKIFLKENHQIKPGKKFGAKISFSHSAFFILILLWKSHKSFNVIYKTHFNVFLLLFIYWSKRFLFRFSISNKEISPREKMRKNIQTKTPEIFALRNINHIISAKLMLFSFVWALSTSFFHFRLHSFHFVGISKQSKYRSCNCLSTFFSIAIYNSIHRITAMEPTTQPFNIMSRIES